MSTLLHPLRLRSFRGLLAAYAVNALGNWAGQIALSAIVLTRTHSPAAVAAVMIAGQFLPALIAPALVARAEAISPRVILPGLLVGEALLFIALAGLSRTGSLQVMLAVIALDGLLAIAARALVKASIVAVTSPLGLLREGNTLLVGAFTLCMAIGPIAAGVTIAIFSPATAMLADAASFIVAAVALTGRIPGLASDDSTDPTEGRLREALTHVRDQPQLRRLLGGYGLLCLASAAILPIEIVLVTHTLHASTSCFGIVLAAWGIGGAAGSALVPRLRHRPLLPLMAASFGLMAASYLGMGIATSISAVVAFSFLGGIGNGIEGFASMTAIQEHTTNEFQARLNGLVESMTAALSAVGFLLGGLTATLSSPRTVYILSGLAILACASTILKPHKTTISPGLLLTNKQAPTPFNQTGEGSLG
jgi:Transmembrane secretion effector